VKKAHPEVPESQPRRDWLGFRRRAAAARRSSRPQGSHRCPLHLCALAQEGTGDLAYGPRGCVRGRDATLSGDHHRFTTQGLSEGATICSMVVPGTSEPTTPEKTP